jgi:hypothetical protein
LMFAQKSGVGVADELSSPELDALAKELSQRYRPALNEAVPANGAAPTDTKTTVRG